MGYCKRCYLRATKFSRLAAQKHIHGLLNSRWADAYLSFWYCTMLTSFNDVFTKHVTGQHKKKQVSDRLEYITHLHQHIWSIHNSYVSKMCINIGNIFAGFWICACWICAKYAKINVPRIFPLLQYSRADKLYFTASSSIVCLKRARIDGQFSYWATFLILGPGHPSMCMYKYMYIYCIFFITKNRRLRTRRALMLFSDVFH